MVGVSLEKLLLLGVQFLGDVDDQVDHKISATIAANTRHALILEKELGSRLCARLDDLLDGLYVVGCGDVDFAAQRGLNEVDVDFGDQMGAVPFEDLTGKDVQDHIEVAIGATRLASVALVPETQTGSSIDARWDVDLHFVGHSDFSITVTVVARIGDDLPCSMTSWTTRRDAEEALGVLYLSATLAGSTGGGSTSGLRSRTATALTHLGCRNLDLGFGTVHGVLELDGELDTDIRTRRRTSPTAPRAETEQIAEAAVNDARSALIR